MITNQNENPYASPLTDNVWPDTQMLPDQQATPCPCCESDAAEPVPYNPLTGRHGPRAIDHMRCKACGTEFNGEMGYAITSTLWRNLFPVLLAGILALIYIGSVVFLTLP